MSPVSEKSNIMTLWSGLLAAWAQAQLYMSVVLPQPPLQLTKARDEIKGMLGDGVKSKKESAVGVQCC
jgi:hypothetical protein